MVVQDCMHEQYRNSIQLHAVGVEEDHSDLNNAGAGAGASRPAAYHDVLTIEGAFGHLIDSIMWCMFMCCCGVIN